MTRWLLAVSLLSVGVATLPETAEARGERRSGIAQRANVETPRLAGRRAPRATATRAQGFVARTEDAAVVYFEPARRNDLGSAARVRLFFDQFTSS